MFYSEILFIFGTVWMCCAVFLIICCCFSSGAMIDTSSEDSQRRHTLFNDEILIIFGTVWMCCIFNNILFFSSGAMIDTRSEDSQLKLSPGIMNIYTFMISSSSLQSSAFLGRLRLPRFSKSKSRMITKVLLYVVYN